MIRIRQSAGTSRQPSSAHMHTAALFPTPPDRAWQILRDWPREVPDAPGDSAWERIYRDDNSHRWVVQRSLNGGRAQRNLQVFSAANPGHSYVELRVFLPVPAGVNPHSSAARCGCSVDLQWMISQVRRHLGAHYHAITVDQFPTQKTLRHLGISPIWPVGSKERCIRLAALTPDLEDARAVELRSVGHSPPVIELKGRDWATMPEPEPIDASGGARLFGAARDAIARYGRPNQRQDSFADDWFLEVATSTSYGGMWVHANESAYRPSDRHHIRRFLHVRDLILDLAGLSAAFNGAR